jgi:hypothetical protein
MKVPIDHRVSFAQLLGMGDGLTRDLLDKGAKVYKYVPYGSFWETVPYLSRRLIENADILTHIISTKNK